MSKKLIAVYKMEVFNDGTVKQTLQEQYATSGEVEAINPDEVSARIRQIIGVIREWVRWKNTDTGAILTSNDVACHAIKYISELEDVSYSTTADKVTRQLYGSMQEFVAALDNFHKNRGNDGTQLEAKLLAAASQRTLTKDRQYISQSLNDIIEKHYPSN